MLIAYNPIIDEYVKSILYGEFIEPCKNAYLAKEYQADKGCPYYRNIFGMFQPEHPDNTIMALI